MIKGVIFDLDGTLLDTLMDLYIATNYALKQNGQPERSYEEVRLFVGNGVEKLIYRALPENKKELLAKVLKEFKDYYSIHSMDNTKPYDGILQMLNTLKQMNIKMAVVSNKFDLAVKELCNPIFKDYMNVFIGESDNVRKKPENDMVLKALNELNLSCDECIYVGDSDVDVLTAKNSNMQCINVTWGFRDFEFLKGFNAAYFANKPSDIIKIIKEINK